MTARQQRSGWRALVTPGWAIAVILALAFTWLAFTVLAPWQLTKGEVVHARNERIREAESLEPVPLADLLPAGPLPDAEEYRQVTVTGSFTDAVVVLRNRPVEAAPAYQILGVFAAESGRNYVIHRGWVPAADAHGTQVDAPPTQPLTLTARLRQPEDVSAATDAQPFADQGHWQVYGIDPTQISELTGTSVEPLYLQLVEGSPGLAGQPFPLPQLDDGPHLSYGVQWIGFGLIVPAGIAYFLWAEVRERRREQELAGEPLPEAATAAAPPDPEAARREKLRQRYGR